MSEVGSVQGYGVGVPRETCPSEGESRQNLLNFCWQEVRRCERTLLTETEVTGLDEKRINVLQLDARRGGDKERKKERRVGSVTDTIFNVGKRKMFRL
jgi:hypothetical protein